MRRNGMLLEIFAYSTASRVFYRPELNLQNRVLYKMCDGLQNILLLQSLKEDGANRQTLCVLNSAFTYYIKLFQTGTDRRKGILMSLLLLVAEEKKTFFIIYKGLSLKQIKHFFGRWEGNFRLTTNIFLTLFKYVRVKPDQGKLLKGMFVPWCSDCNSDAALQVWILFLLNVLVKLFGI